MSAGIRKPINIAVFVSGGGSTLQALLENQHQFNIRIVISNKKNTLAEKKAKRFGIRTIVIDKSTSYDQLSINLKSFSIELIFLAGFMRLLPPDFVQTWNKRIFNIHPSLLPQYAGLNAIEKNYEAKSNMGVSLHVVTKEMDAGKVILQKMSSPASLNESISFNEAQTWLRRTEQHLLREFIYKKAGNFR